MNEFFNPKATVTPGALGALMMLIANTFCHIFPEIPFRYIALFLSFLIATIVFVNNKKINIPQKFALWILNALVIFSVGIGSTNIAANITENNKEYGSMISSAFAQNQNSTITPPQNSTITPPQNDWPTYKDGKFKGYKSPQQQQFFKKW